MLIRRAATPGAGGQCRWWVPAAAGGGGRWRAKGGRTLGDATLREDGKVVRVGGVIEVRAATKLDRVGRVLLVLRVREQCVHGLANRHHSHGVWVRLHSTHGIGIAVLQARICRARLQAAHSPGPPATQEGGGDAAQREAHVFAGGRKLELLERYMCKR